MSKPATKSMTIRERIQRFLNSHRSPYAFISSPEILDILSQSEQLPLASELDPKLGPIFELTLGKKQYYVREILDKKFLLVRKEFFNESLVEVRVPSDIKSEFGLVYLVTQFPLDELRRGSEEQLEVSTEEPPLTTIGEPESGSYIKLSDSEEQSIYLSRKFKEQQIQKYKRFTWRPCFASPGELFSNFLLLGKNNLTEKLSPAGDNKVIKTPVKNWLYKNYQSSFDFLLEDFKDFKTSLIEVVPTPEEKYKKSLEKTCKYSQKSKYFNAHFPFPVVRELNNSHHFWLSLSSQYKKVDDFAIQLKNYYSSLSFRQLDQLVEQRNNEEVSTRIWSKLQQRATGLHKYESQNNSFKKLLDEKINQLQAKNDELTSYLTDLQQKLSEEGKSPDTDVVYLQTLKEKKAILEDIEKTLRVLEEYSLRIQRFSSPESSNFEAHFYLTIFGSNAILSQYDWLVGNTLFELNDQINEIVYYQQEIEKTFFEKLSILHKARKAELKLEFISQDRELSKLIYQQKEKEKRLLRSDQLKELEIQGSLQVSKSNVQKKINEEKAKLSRYLDRLNRLDSYPDYEDRSRSLRERKELFKQKVGQYREEIYALKLKVERIEAQYSSFLSSLREEILDFQKNISNSYSLHLSLLNSSTSQVWSDWAKQGIGYIERILSRKDKLMREFSEIIVLNLKKMYLSQEELLEESKKREKEWERVYSEMVEEFKTLGYFLSKPKPSEHYYRFLPKMERSHLSLSPEIEKLIYFKPMLKYSAPKVNELIGLSPKLLNDEEFLVIDQVWTKLTPMQEHYLRQKVARENQEKDKERIEELLKKQKEEMHKKLQSKNYCFRKMTFEEDFPQEADEEERMRRLKSFEKAQFHNWKETNFTSSEVRYKFKDMLSNLTKRVITLKGVEVWGNNLNISDKGELEDPSLVERLGEWDYFIKSKDKLSFIESCGLSSFKLDESETFDLEGESYLSILETLEDRDSEIKNSKVVGKPNKPTIDDWLNLNLKRYREEKKKIDIVEVKEGLLSLEREIEVLKKTSGNYKEACELERSKREILCAEMKKELEDIQQYLEQESKELEEIFIQSQDMLNLSFEEIDKKLAERRKNILELKMEKKPF
ncbi:hypothetical protein [Mycoplasma suis]|uniref:Uncharacterized protein n=2 Tax=Mycoplasma suis TaxID=57372 RepID=F0QR20_MYCSL|nr:hypothetical protein [Mycoplasma suis]ADX97940.1 Conserved hypothetical protein [Mycoplasma suis str. Illinois]CBZ40436.1 hypothetical protein MSUIS_03430 [Mycoplasma suis KI3806]